MAGGNLRKPKIRAMANEEQGVVENIQQGFCDFWRASRQEDLSLTLQPRLAIKSLKLLN